ncbi:helix-turn-helix domain-containing protein [Bacillus sp. T33-2]|uniref:helix-turn-helix domain-containing protein n=1 Tax=Bacillus sp. T33-2 TaxID=2054168 RepID=UPI000C7771BD|nr:helix-turn-helix domain-containing protein [Bacillus sp. T33-2]PLR94835.1 hypothetical protein CVD19_16310 [Bacillus sp. T33-2]
MNFQNMETFRTNGTKHKEQEDPFIKAHHELMAKRSEINNTSFVQPQKNKPKETTLGADPYITSLNHNTDPINDLIISENQNQMSRDTIANDSRGQDTEIVSLIKKYDPDLQQLSLDHWKQEIIEQEKSFQAEVNEEGSEQGIRDSKEKVKELQPGVTEIEETVCITEAKEFDVPKELEVPNESEVPKGDFSNEEKEKTIKQKMAEHAKKFYEHKKKGLKNAEQKGNGVGYLILFNGIEDILLDRAINNACLRFYIFLLKNMDHEKGYLFHSNKKLAEMYGVSERQVKNYLKELSEHGLIERLIRNDNSAITLIKPIEHRSKR